MLVSCRSYEWVMSRNRKRRTMEATTIWRTNSSAKSPTSSRSPLICTSQVMSHSRVGHVTHIHDVYHTYDGVDGVVSTLQRKITCFDKHIYMYMHVCKYVRIMPRMYECVYVCAYMYACIDINMYTYILTHLYTYVHTYTCTQTWTCKIEKKTR